MFAGISSFMEGVKKSVVDSVQTAPEIIPIGTRRVRITSKLGEGGYSFVYSVDDVDNGEHFALKRMLCQEDESKRNAESEINILKTLGNHPNLIGYFGSAKRAIPRPPSTEYFILMELCDGGSLISLVRHHMANRTRFTESQLEKIFSDIIRAVAHLHSQRPPIAHRDLKIENVLLSSKGVFKLCDFGSCTTRAQVYSTAAEISGEEERIQKYSTAMYRAPEMADLYKRELVNEKVDIWALGCILYTIAFFVQPFQEGGNLQIISGSYEWPDVIPYSQHCVQLIKSLLTASPIKRPDINAVHERVIAWQAFLKNQIPDLTPDPIELKKAESKGKKEAKKPAKKVVRPTTSANGNNGNGNGTHAASGPWICSACKYNNIVPSDACVVCHVYRPQPPSVARPPISSPSPSRAAVTPGWAADWDPFDAPTSASAAASSAVAPHPSSSSSSSTSLPQVSSVAPVAPSKTRGGALPIAIATPISIHHMNHPQYKAATAATPTPTPPPAPTIPTIGDRAPVTLPTTGSNQSVITKVSSSSSSLSSSDGVGRPNKENVKELFASIDWDNGPGNDGTKSNTSLTNPTDDWGFVSPPASKLVTTSSDVDPGDPFSPHRAITHGHAHAHGGVATKPSVGSASTPFTASFPDFDDFDDKPTPLPTISPSPPSSSSSSVVLPITATNLRRESSSSSQPGAPSPQASPSHSSTRPISPLPSSIPQSSPTNISATSHASVSSVASSNVMASLSSTSSIMPSMALVSNPSSLSNATLRAYLDSQGLMHGDIMDTDGDDGHHELVRRVQRATLAQLMHPELVKSQSSEAAAAAERAAQDFFFQPSQPNASSSSSPSPRALNPNQQVAISSAAATILHMSAPSTATAAKKQ